MTEDETRVALERIFAQTLDGHPLISNRSIWRQFPIVHNERWSVGNKVILGDALHTAHFSIGSGTRLAIEDAIALARAIKAQSARRSGGARSLMRRSASRSSTSSSRRPMPAPTGTRISAPTWRCRPTTSRCRICRAPGGWISSASARWRRNSWRNGNGGDNLQRNAVHPGLMVRSIAKQCVSNHRPPSSFETPASRAPQDEGGIYCGFSPMPPAIMLRMICEVPATTVAMRESR